MHDSPILLDTHVLIWLHEDRLGEAVTTVLLAAALKGELFVSTVSGWEISLLHSRSIRTGAGPTFTPDPKTWFLRAVRAPGIRETPITSEIAIDSSFLPGTFHRDPGDRMLVATARHLGAALATSDQAILDYAAAGHVQALPC